MANFLLGLSGFWNKLDGAKTYIGGGVLLLSSSAGLLSEVLKLIADKDPIEVWGFIKALPQDQFVLSFAAGLVAVGLRHAIAKSDAPSAPAAPANPA